MATWPSDLVVTRENLQETPPDRVLRTPMDVGIDKTRKRSSNAARQVTVSFFLTDAQTATLDAFYLANDAVTFDFVDPRTNTTKTARFRSPPQYRLEQTYWTVSVELEFLP